MPYANLPGTRRCQVPAGGGESTCTAPIPGQSAQPGTFTCTIPPGGGGAVCHRSGRTTGPDPTAPAAPPQAPPPADPGAPTTPTTAAPAPGEYRCTIPEGGGPATCEPA